jgi:branched-chain amino acid transport system permease protein
MADWPLTTQLVMNGLANGFIYALLALGFTLTWKGARTANLAQGDFATYGMFAAIVFYGDLGWPLIVAVLLAIIAGFVLGVVMDLLTIHPLRRASVETKMVATLGVSIMLSNGIRLIFGPAPRYFPQYFGSQLIPVGQLNLSRQYIGTAILVILLIGALQLFFYRTMLGKALRAVAANRDVASLMGINPDRLIALAFGFSAALGALAGVLLAPLVFVSPDLSTTLVVNALLAAVIGGFGSYPGALIGGLFIGVLEDLDGFYISTNYSDVIAFAVLIAVLLIRPRGLFGPAYREA